MSIKTFFNLTYYTSKLDQFLKELFKRCEPTASQCAEIEKHDRIAFLRDHAVETPKNNAFWDKF